MYREPVHIVSRRWKNDDDDNNDDGIGTKDVTCLCRIFSHLVCHAWIGTLGTPSQFSVLVTWLNII